MYNIVYNIYISFIIMKSIIFSFVSKEWEECYCVWSESYYKNVVSWCSQQILYCVLYHSENDWKYMESLSDDELYFALTQYIKNNEIKVINLQ